jgi:hypothetical protein
MAQHTGIATQTLSRFERDVQVPRDVHVLMKLRDAALDAGLNAEAQLFDDALSHHPSSPPRPASAKPETPQQWRLMQCARVASLFYPSEAEAIAKVASRSLAVVDEIIAGAGDGPLDSRFYSDLESRIISLAARRVFENLKKEGGQ